MSKNGSTPRRTSRSLFELASDLLLWRVTETIVAGNVYHVLPEPTAASASVEELATLPDEVAAAIERLSLSDQVSTASLYVKDPKLAGQVHLRAGCHGASTLTSLADAARQKRSLCALCKTYRVPTPHVVRCHLPHIAHAYAELTRLLR
jgi:hypothetical protein